MNEPATKSPSDGSDAEQVEEVKLSHHRPRVPLGQLTPNVSARFDSPRTQVSNLLNRRNFDTLNFSCILKKTSPDDFVDVILSRMKPLNVSSSLGGAPPELPSFLSEETAEEERLEVYPKSLNFGVLPSGCWNVKELTLSSASDTLVEVTATSSHLVTLFSTGQDSSSYLRLEMTPGNSTTLQVKLESSEDQTEKEKVEAELEIKANGLVTEIVPICALLGSANLTKSSLRLEIFPSIRKEESFLIKNTGNLPLTLGCLGPEFPLKSGDLKVSEKHLILDPDVAAYALKVTYESDTPPVLKEEGHLLLQSLPNGPLHKIPFLIHHRELSDFPIEADEASLAWKPDSHTRSISLKNSTDSDVPCKLILQSLFGDSLSFSILDGGNSLTQKNILFPSNSVLTFQLLCKRKEPPSDPGPHGKLFVKLLNTPFKASIPLFVLENPLLSHPDSCVISVKAPQNSFSISNQSHSLISWKAQVSSNSASMSLSQYSGLLRPSESKELLIYLSEPLDNKEIIFQSRSLDSDFSKCHSSRMSLLVSEPRVKSPLYLKESHITFPKVAPGNEALARVTLKNRTQREETLELFVLGGNNSSFSVRLPNITIHPRSYLRFPVMFKPESLGLHTSLVSIRNSYYELTACLCGEAIE